MYTTIINPAEGLKSPTLSPIFPQKNTKEIMCLTKLKYKNTCQYVGHDSPRRPPPPLDTYLQETSIFIVDLKEEECLVVFSYHTVHLYCLGNI